LFVLSLGTGIIRSFIWPRTATDAPGTPETVEGSEAAQRRSQEEPHFRAEESREAEDV
jgi:hypothetical protein